MQQSECTGLSAISGSFGLFTSQMYDVCEALSILQSWNYMIEKATENLLPPSGNQLI